MSDYSDIDYSFLDRPEVLSVLFHPRPEGAPVSPENATDVLIPVDKGASVGGRFFMDDPSAPNILFFHGNGEIVADYDDLGPVYNRMGLNFLAVDYRGYGHSTGSPSVSGMMRDCHKIFEFTGEFLVRGGFTGALVVMGRSLGSAPALELAHRHKGQIGGLIVESGFAFLGPLLSLLSIDPAAIGFTEERGTGNLDKIRGWDKPLLVIHAQRDHIIPFSDGQALYDACPSADKTLLMVPAANHNDILMRGLDSYLKAVKTLCGKAAMR